MQRQITLVTLGVMVAFLGFAVGSLQASGRPDDMVWQVVASGSSLKSVYVTADGRRGWAVGARGSIIATEDGGGHWTPQTSSTSNDLLGVAFAADGRRGWAVGLNGSILATEDGGEHWTPQTSSTSQNLSGIAFAKGGHRGWAVGSNGTILLPVERTDLDKPSIKLAQSALRGEIEVSFILHSNPWLPIWASRAALEAAGLSARATPLLEALISGGVIERRTFGGIAVLRFGLDPVAEYLTAIQSVSDLRQLGRAAVVTRINALMEIEEYPKACDGYLKAFATCYRAYRGAFGLPDMAFSWEFQEESPSLLLQKSWIPLKS